MTDANGRTGLDYAQAANHDKKQIGMWLGAATRRTRPRTAGKWSTFATKRDCAWAILGEMVNQQLSLRCLPQAIDLTTLPLGRNALMLRKSRLAHELGKWLQLSSQYDHVPVHFRLPPARRWRRGNDRDPPCPAETVLPCVGR